MVLLHPWIDFPATILAWDSSQGKSIGRQRCGA
jgi:hypothetical protein